MVSNFYQTTSLLLLLLSTIFYHESSAQTGAGCTVKTCPQPGQVRIDAIYGQSGNFVGGCNCGCDWHALSSPSSPLYCPPPRNINFNPQTLSGDCSCSCPPNSQRPSECTYPHTYNAQTCSCECPQYSPSASSCPLHQVFDQNICHCVCPNVGSPGGPCIGADGNMLPDTTVNPDCSCQCPVWSANAADCEATGRVLRNCECACPDTQCPGYQTKDAVSCLCSCQPCPNGYFLLDEYSCQCVPNPTPAPTTSAPTIYMVDPKNPPAIPPGARWCCHTTIPNFMPYYGRCWGATNGYDCASEPYQRCTWDEYRCNAEPPSCYLRDWMCTEHAECCSNVCKSDGLCR